MLSWDIIGQLVWTGLASSTYYCLFAIAFALMLKVNRVWNFGQAGMMVVAYFSMFVSFRVLGLPPALGILIGAAVTIAFSLAIEWFGFRVLRARNSSVLTYFIFTIILSQFAIYTAELIFGPDPKTLFASIMSPVFLVGPIAVSHWDLQALAATAVLMIALAAFLSFTKDGPIPVRGRRQPGARRDLRDQQRARLRHRHGDRRGLRRRRHVPFRNPRGAVSRRRRSTSS